MNRPNLNDAAAFRTWLESLPQDQTAGLRSHPNGCQRARFLKTQGASGGGDGGAAAVKTLATMFSGGGLADVGFRAAGYLPVGAVEWDETIAGVYADNHGAGHVLCQPVEETDYRQWEGIDHLHASPCCTSASVANQDGGETWQDVSAGLAVCRAIRECRPATFSLENVWQYRHFHAFARIIRALYDLRYTFGYSHVNAADVGVPQTRRRLILRAVRTGPLPPLEGTHGEGAGRSAQLCLMEERAARPWIGWYAAVEDLLPGLPVSRFAEWQLRRLPEELRSCLVSNAATEFSDGLRDAGEPALSVTQQQGGRLRAFLIDGVNGHAGGGAVHRLTTQPARTVQANAGHRPANVPRAWLVDDQYGSNNSAAERKLRTLAPDDPAFSVMATPKMRQRALLVHPTDQRSMPVARGDDPAFTVTTGGALCGANGSAGFKPRAWLEHGRVVQMTPRALARFQSVPDTYRLPSKNALACRVIGNAVPPLLAQRIAESFER